jgi:hypothetical protein
MYPGCAYYVLFTTWSQWVVHGMHTLKCVYKYKHAHGRKQNTIQCICFSSLTKEEGSMILGSGISSLSKNFIHVSVSGVGYNHLAVCKMRCV